MFPDMIPIVRSALTEAMRELGWVEKRDVEVIESGFQYGGAQAEQAAKRVVALKPDLIITTSSSYTLVMHRATATIPIVMWASGYPVEVGLAHSLARPGKNVTGNSLYAGTGIWGKVQELLREAKPEIKRIGVCWGYVPPDYPKAEIDPCYRELRQAAQALGVALDIVEFAPTGKFAAALEKIDVARPDALVITSGPSIWAMRAQLMDYATRKRLPTIVDWAWPTGDSHPLLVYAPTTLDLVRRALAYVERIKRGAKPGDLPIQLPSRFELLVSRKTAKLVGIQLPQSMLARADRVIE
jgi:putative ABC transport system substrate-binding protein